MVRQLVTATLCLVAAEFQGKAVRLLNNFSKHVVGACVEILALCSFLSFFPFFSSTKKKGIKGVTPVGTNLKYATCNVTSRIGLVLARFEAYKIYLYMMGI